MRSNINQFIIELINIFNTRIALITRATQIKNIYSTNVDENFNFLNERKFKNNKQRNNFLINNVNREFDDLTILLQFNNRK